MTSHVVRLKRRCQQSGCSHLIFSRPLFRLLAYIYAQHRLVSPPRHKVGTSCSFPSPKYLVRQSCRLMLATASQHTLVCRRILFLALLPSGKERARLTTRTVSAPRKCPSREVGAPDPHSAEKPKFGRCYFHIFKPLGYHAIMNSLTRMIGKAQRECVSDDALKHFRTYKYSSVDKSPISQHILRHYVRPPCKS